MIRTTSVWAVLLVLAFTAGQAMGASTFYLSTVPLSAPTPVVGTPDVTINVGDSVTLYFWAEFPTGANSVSTAMGWDFKESNPAIVDGSNAEAWNGPLNLNDDPGDGTPPNDWGAVYRWNDWNPRVGMDSNSVGFGAAGGFIDPNGVTAIGLSPAQKANGDPTWRGTVNPFEWYLGSVTFTGAIVGQTDIFLTVNEVLMLGRSTMIGTPTAPAMKIGAGEATAAPVSTKIDNGVTTYYIDAGVTGALADAHITVVPEPASLALLALSGLALIRRR